MHNLLFCPARCGWIAIVLLGALPAAGATAESAPSKPAAPSPRRPGRLILEEPAEPFRPKHPRTEAERDKLEAITLFSMGRMLEHRGDHDAALRRYQRALRYDPEALTVARAIVRLLAVHLKRPAEAVRYALKVAELEDSDPMLLRQLGMYLTEEGRWDRAARLYEKSLALEGPTDPQDPKALADETLLRMELGRVYYLAGEYPKAADHFARVLHVLDHPKQFPLETRIREALLDKPAAIYRLFGECFLEAGRLDEALALFQKAEQEAPNPGLLGYHEAQVAARREKTEKALAGLEAYFSRRLDGEGTAPYELLAKLLEKSGKKDELIPRLKRLRDADPDNPPLGYFLAKRYLEAGQADQAELLYRALLEKAPMLDGYQALVRLYREKKNPDALLDILGKVVGQLGSLEPLGKETKALCEDAALVELFLDHARRRAQEQPEAFGYSERLATALVATEAGRFDAAADFFELAMAAQSDDTAELLLVWGLEATFRERFAEAARVFQRGADRKSLKKMHPAFLYYQAGALEMDGRTDEALAAARKAFALNKDSAQYQSRIAWILYHAKRFPEAAEAYRDLIARFDAHHESAEVREVMREARLVLSSLCVLEGRLDEAEEWLEQVLDEFPDDPGAQNDLGFLWADRGKHLRRAHRMIQKAVDAEPDNIAYRDSLGWVLYRLGRFDEAVGELEKAARGESPDAVILDHLGDAYQAAGKNEKARETRRRAAKALRDAGKNEEADKVEAKIHNLKSKGKKEKEEEPRINANERE